MIGYPIEMIINTDSIKDEYNEGTINAINSSNVKLIKNSKDLNGVCFNYALNDKYGFIKSCEQAYSELKLSHVIINIKKARKGDIISYHELSDYHKFPHSWNVLHFAIIEKMNKKIEKIIILSKWGMDGVFKTTVEEVPDVYGNTIVIWRKKKRRY